MGIRAATLANPDKPAIIMVESGEAVSYGELSDRADQYANFFRRLGFETGDSIAFTLEICPEFFAVCIGALVHCGPDFSISTGALTRTGHDRRSLRKILQQFRLPDSRVIAGFAGHPAGKLQQNS